MSVQGLTIPKLPDFMMPVPVVKAGEDVGKYIRLALMTAILSVAFEQGLDWFRPDSFHWSFLTVLTLGAVIILAATLTENYSRIAIAVFSAFFIYDISTAWATPANHTWLAVWTIPLAIVFQNGGNNHCMRITCGLL